MRNTSKRALFFLLSFLFLAGAPLLIAYSQGYRVDWSTRSISQTGGIYVKAVPGRALVRVGSREPKTTDFLFGTILIDNLLSEKAYEVTVSKEGYYPWSKTLSVQPQGVTEAKNVVLVPVNPAFTKVSNGVRQISFAPNGRYAVLNGTDLINLATGKLTPLSSSPAKSVWSLDGTRLLLGNSVFTLESSQCAEGCRIQSSFTKALFTNDALLLLSGSTLRLVSYTAGSSTTLANDALDAVVSDADRVFWMNKTGEVWASNPFEPIAQAEVSASSSLLTFQNTLFLLDEGELLRLLNGQTVSVFSEAKKAVLAPDGKKLVIQKGSELWLHYLTDEAGQPARRTGDTVFLTRFSEVPENLAWFTSHYLVFTVAGRLTLMETDTRDHLNMVEVGTFLTPEVFWSQSQKRLYLLSESVLSSSPQLLP